MYESNLLKAESVKSELNEANAYNAIKAIFSWK